MKDNKTEKENASPLNKFCLRTLVFVGVSGKIEAINKSSCLVPFVQNLLFEGSFVCAVSLSPD